MSLAEKIIEAVAAVTAMKAPKDHPMRGDVRNIASIAESILYSAAESVLILGITARGVVSAFDENKNSSYEELGEECSRMVDVLSSDLGLPESENAALKEKIRVAVAAKKGRAA